MKKNENSETCYPRFISNSPCSEDLFEGHSHSKIAGNIADLLIRNTNVNIIGIDGGWGSGKSNLVKLVEKDIENKGFKNFHFFTYDAWAFQNDYQKRSILETLVSDLIEKNIITDSKWNAKLMQLLSKKSSAGSKVVKELNPITKIGAIFAFLLPFFNLLYNKIPEFKYKNCLWLVPAVLFVIFLFIFQIRNMKKYGQEISFSSFFHDLFYSYLDYTDNTQNVEESIKYETIYEKEASTRDFKNWMRDIDKDLIKTHLVIVFDNMDRLPSKKVQELWAAITGIFSDITYGNISVIVPFDRIHIKNAFKNENITEGTDSSDTQNSIISHTISYGDDFINKTFSVVFRVSPPTMSNWKKYFELKWNEALNGNPEYSVTQIYDLLTPDQTPRKIIAFINEFVSLRLLFTKETIPDKYIALFIFGRSAITNSPDSEIINPTYLKSLDFLYREDEDLPKYSAALYYQLDPQNALEIIFEKKVITALNNNDCKALEEIKKLPIFSIILQSAITKVTNYENAIITLNTCLDDGNSDNQYVWDTIYRKVSKKENKLEAYQAILVEQITDKESYLKRIFKEYANAEKFNIEDYFKSLDYFCENIVDIEVDKFFEEKTVTPEDFIKFLKLAKEDYKIYKVQCDINQLDNYLKELKIDQLKESLGLNYLNSEAKEFPLYKESLSKKITNDPVNKDLIPYLFERLKEIEDPVEEKLSDSSVINLFAKFSAKDDFYYDLICMGIAKGASFSNSNQTLSNQLLKKTDSDLVKEIASRIGFYICNSDLFEKLEAMKKYPLFLEVCKEIIYKKYSPRSAEIESLLKNYKKIKDNLQIEPKIIFDFINDWKHSVNKVTLENLNEVSIEYFEDGLEINDDVFKHCKKMALEYLSKISSDDWKVYIEKASYEYKLLITLQQKNENCYEAFKYLMLEKAKGNNVIQKETAQSLISLSVSHKRSLKNLFDDIRDLFCSGNYDMTSFLFDFFGKWLFEFSDLSKKEDGLRRILPTNILDDENVISTLLQNQEKTKKLISCSNDSQDFKDKVTSLAESKYAKNEDFIIFAKSLGLEVSLQEEDS